jgi:hypothetical protein
VSQDLANSSQGRTLTEHGSGGGMPQDVSTVDRRFDPRPPQCASDDVGVVLEQKNKARREFGKTILSSNRVHDRYKKTNWRKFHFGRF